MAISLGSSQRRAMSYDDLKIVEAYRLVQSTATGKAHGATVEDAFDAVEIIEAMAESARSRHRMTSVNLS
jgi:hypothetical protein